MRIEQAVRLGLMTLDEVAAIRRDTPRTVFELVPVQALSHIVTATFADRASAMLHDWDVARLTPIRLTKSDTPGRHILVDGHHRLHTMRRLGHREIPAVISDKADG